MVCQPLRLALLIGAITAVAVSPARAHHNSAPCCNPCPTACATAPAYRTITCTECVPETYTVKRVCYKIECQTQTYQGCRTECVPVCKERVCTVWERVPCVQTVTKKCCKYVQTCETRTVMKPCYSYVTETCMKKQLVCRGHWECQCVPACSLFHKSNCCDPCGSCCTPMKVKKVWVNCPEYRECPVQVCKKVCTMVPTTCQVNCCKPVWYDVQCQVCTYKCVPKQCVQKYTCYETRTVPCTCTRVCRVCVPYETCVTCTRWVTKQVCKQVPCTPCCQPTCCQPTCCQPCCKPARCKPARCCKPSCCQTVCCQPRCNSCCCR